MVLCLLKICAATLDQPDVLLDLCLIPQRLPVQFLHDFSFFHVQPLSEVFELARDLMFHILIVIIDFALSHLELAFLNLELFDLLVHGVQKRFKLLRDGWVSFPQGLNLMTLMFAVDDAFGANRRAMAGEAEVADRLFWMMLAGNTDRHLGAANAGWS